MNSESSERLNIVVLDFYSEQKLIEQMIQSPQHFGSEFIGLVIW